MLVTLSIMPGKIAFRAGRAAQPPRCLTAPRQRASVVASSAAGAGASAVPPEVPTPAPANGGAPASSSGASGVLGWWQAQQEKSAALRKKLVALGPAAVLAYGERRCDAREREEN